MDNSLDEKFHFNTDFLREQRKVWSLQHDVDLLNNLETFSQGLMKKTCFLLDSMDDFQREINITGVEVKTISNSFEGVSDSQFVENRVYDEEEVMICEDEKPINDSTTLNLNKRLEESLKQCAKSLESKFEELNITMSDSEEDIDVFNKGEVILIPKNRYKSRPLPHLFDGQEIFSDNSLGLLPSNDTEDGGENLLCGEDNVQHLESSSIDDVDNCVLKDNLFTTTTNEIKDISSHEKNEGALIENKKTDLKQSFNEDEQFMDDSLTEEKRLDSQPAIDNVNPLSFHNIAQGVEINSAIADEIKGIFGVENYEGNAKSSVLRKLGKMVNEETIKKNVEQTYEGKSGSKGNKERDSGVPVPLIFNEQSPPRKIPREPKHEHFPQNVPFTTNLPPQTNHFEEEKMSEEDILPHVQTEVLHSLAKNRPKIKGKRRLPTRRQKTISQDNEADKAKHVLQDNVLSPSTDEEDLFVIPNLHIPKESSSDSLFGGPSLFSPGSFIEEENKKEFISSIGKKEEKKEMDKKEDIEEPLGIKKSQFDSDKRNSNFFSDWDPFNTDDSVLFSSVERKTRKTKLFDGIDESSSQKSSKDTDDDDLFLFSSNNASNSSSFLFSTSVSSKSGLTTSNENVSKVSQLLTDDSSSENLFSSSHQNDFSNLEKNFEKLNFNRQPDFGSKLSGNKQVTEEKRENALYSNPLMDTDDNLFN